MGIVGNIRGGLLGCVNACTGSSLTPDISWFKKDIRTHGPGGLVSPLGPTSPASSPESAPMARRKSQPETVRAKFLLAERLRTVRSELFGERGGPELARRLGIPIRTWYNYESGVTVPSEVLLRFIELTAVEPVWLLHGTGPKFRRASPPPEDSEGKPGSVVKLLRTALRQLEGDPNAEGPPPSWSAEGSDRGAINYPEGRSVRMEGEAMAPIIADGAFVAFADDAQDLKELDGKLVVAWIDGQPLVRWFELSGHFAVLRAENPAFEPSMVLIDLEGMPRESRIRRVLWIGTPH